MELMKPNEVATDYRVTEATLANWRWAGKGPRLRQGRRASALPPQ
jgi:hypothetical protein